MVEQDGLYPFWADNPQVRFDPSAYYQYTTIAQQAEHTTDNRGILVRFQLVVPNMKRLILAILLALAFTGTVEAGERTPVYGSNTHTCVAIADEVRLNLTLRYTHYWMYSKYVSDKIDRGVNWDLFTAIELDSLTLGPDPGKSEVDAFFHRWYNYCRRYNLHGA